MSILGQYWNVEGMAEEKQQPKTAGAPSSRIGKMLLVIIAALFTFGGPYLAYALIHILNVEYFLSMISGFVLLMVGLVLIWYVIRRKVVS
jgi:hypothetical protein